MASNMFELKGSWFHEVYEQWPGSAYSLEFKEVLYHQKSEFQDILVLESVNFGRVLVLDGIIQYTTVDEFIYHEAISHLPMFAHPSPKSVLVIGGGDGGVLREVGKHSMVEEIHLCDIDAKVIEVCKQYTPTLAVGFDNPKVKVHILDGKEFIKERKESFDVIITDAPEPNGPAAALFEAPYFKLVRDALKPGGVMCMQAECLFADLDIIEGFAKDLKEVFGRVRYAHISPPSAGQVGFLLAGKGKDTKVEVPTRTITDQEAAEWKLQYYDTEVHRASFVLPRFAKFKLNLGE